MVVTGIPGHGKSTWTMNLCVNLARKHGWRVGVASFEIPTVPALRFKLRLAGSGLGTKHGPATTWRRRTYSFNSTSFSSTPIRPASPTTT
uniref:Uncharacterized protein n=1 Tax=Rhizobium leguminosarum TaxID=384 RepID=A0A179BEA4_RHILE|nr:hypothetical protein [Rhizobium leguminosarum]OAP90047.1 hypothetical protein A4U53_31045 [Rhizobium leguminosarum]